MEVLLTILGTLVLIPILVMYNAFTWGFIATIFYGWFILPIYPDAPIFNMLEFSGISFFLHTILPTATTTVKEEFKEEYNTVKLLLKPWLLLLAGWIMHLFY